MKKVIKYNINDMKNIVSMLDFYKKVGICDQYGDNWLIKDVKNCKMNTTQCLKLLDFMLANHNLRKNDLRKQPKAVYEFYINLEWTNYSPVSRDEVPEDEIWVEV